MLYKDTRTLQLLHCTDEVFEAETVPLSAVTNYTNMVSTLVIKFLNAA